MEDLKMIDHSAYKESSSSTAEVSSEWVTSLSRRYRDAYTVAFSIIARGERLKTTAVLVGILIALLSVVLAVIALGDDIQFVLGIIPGLLIAAFVGAAIYGHGILIAAQGQLLLTSIDTAVNTSRFLANHEQAKIMRL
jgi:hypothetical protein